MSIKVSEEQILETIEFANELLDMNLSTEFEEGVKKSLEWVLGKSENPLSLNSTTF